MENTPTSIWQSSDEVVDYDELETETCQRISDAVADADPILDVGCGEGRLVNFLAMILGREVWGIDNSSSKLVKAREVAKARGVSHLVRFMEGDASDLGFLADESFAAVVSRYTLHELENPLSALKELRRLLGVGGKLIVVDFVKGGKAEKLWGESYYTPQEIESMLEKAGFGNVATEFVSDDVIFVSSLKVLERWPSDEQAGESPEHLLGFQ